MTKQFLTFQRGAKKNQNQKNSWYSPNMDVKVDPRLLQNAKFKEFYHLYAILKIAPAVAEVVSLSKLM